MKALTRIQTMIKEDHMLLCHAPTKVVLSIVLLLQLEEL